MFITRKHKMYRLYVSIDCRESFTLTYKVPVVSIKTRINFHGSIQLIKKIILTRMLKKYYIITTKIL